MTSQPAAADGPPLKDLPPPPVPPRATTAIFADLDGTLADIRPTPGDVKPDAVRDALLARLAGALDGRLAVISGRDLEDLDRVLEGRIKALGAVHGLVRRSANGELSGRDANPDIALAVKAFKALACGHPGLLVEDKGVAAAIHFRLAPNLADACKALAVRLAADHGLDVQRGDMVVEVRAPGPDKGDAVLLSLYVPGAYREESQDDAAAAVRPTAARRVEDYSGGPAMDPYAGLGAWGGGRR